MKPAPVFETSVRELGECGGHFWAPAYGEPEELNGCQHVNQTVANHVISLTGL